VDRIDLYGGCFLERGGVFLMQDNHKKSQLTADFFIF